MLARGKSGGTSALSLRRLAVTEMLPPLLAALRHLLASCGGVDNQASDEPRWRGKRLELLHMLEQTKAALPAGGVSAKDAEPQCVALRALGAELGRLCQGNAAQDPNASSTAARVSKFCNEPF